MRIVRQTISTGRREPLQPLHNEKERLEKLTIALLVFLRDTNHIEDFLCA